VKRAAGILLVRPWDFRVLLVRRTKSKPHTWAFPGGKVESGETDLEGAMREFREEMGSLPRMEVFPDPYACLEVPGFTFAIFMAGLKAPRFWEPELDREHDAFGWYLPWELPRPVMSGARQAIHAFLL
jgi:8-oxo-dGTP pyrophosphatase MutT (NUDIX family)